MRRENDVYACHSTVMQLCEEHVSGFVHNIYPCSTNARFAFRELAKHRISVLYDDEEMVRRFDTSLLLGYKMCADLHYLANDIVSPRPAIYNESCLNAVIIISISEIWNGIR